MIFAGVWMMFGHSGWWGHWIAVIVSTSFASSGVGYLAAATTRPGMLHTFSFLSCTFSPPYTPSYPLVPTLTTHLLHPSYLGPSSTNSFLLFLLPSSYFVPPSNLSFLLLPPLFIHQVLRPSMPLYGYLFFPFLVVQNPN